MELAGKWAAENLNAIDCRVFGSEARLHHIGLAVESIRAVCPSCEPFVEQSQGVSLAFIELHGLTIELLEPLGEDSPIARSLRDGIKLLHLCYEVPDLDESLTQCASAGFHRISRTACAPAFGNRRFVWVYSKQYGLIELLEKS
jgi:Glyoxalase/Bleomycin resistance protein/Dioxygenase superfamily